MKKYILNNLSEETINILEGYKEVENRTGIVLFWNIRSITEGLISKRYGLDIYDPDYFIKLEIAVKKNYINRVPRRLSKWNFSNKMKVDGKLEITTSNGWIRIEEYNEE